MGVSIFEGGKAERLAKALEAIADTIADSYVLYDAVNADITTHSGMANMKLCLDITLPKKYKAKMEIKAYAAFPLNVYLISKETKQIIGIETFSLAEGVNSIELANRYPEDVYLGITCSPNTVYYANNGIKPVKFTSSTGTWNIGNTVTAPGSGSNSATFALKVIVYGPMTSMVGDTPAKSPWFGKKANFIGDSITRGSYKATDNSSAVASPTFVDIIKDKLQFVACRNYGINAASISGASGESPNNAFVNRYSSMDNDADAVFVLGGTNDYGTSVPLGTSADTTDVSFYGALDVLCRGLIEKYLGKRIVFVTPIPRQHETANSAGAALEQYRQAIFDIARDRYGLAVIDGKTLGISTADSAFKATYIYDGLHPTQLGHNMMGEALSHIISAM